jgi:hypothetical protein
MNNNRKIPAIINLFGPNIKLIRELGIFVNQTKTTPASVVLQGRLELKKHEGACSIYLHFQILN